MGGNGGFLDRLADFCSRHKILTLILLLLTGSLISGAIERRGFERGQRNAMEIMKISNRDRW